MIIITLGWQGIFEKMRNSFEELKIHISPSLLIIRSILNTVKNLTSQSRIWNINLPPKTHGITKMWPFCRLLSLFLCKYWCKMNWTKWHFSKAGNLQWHSGNLVFSTLTFFAKLLGWILNVCWHGHNPWKTKLPQILV